MNKDTVIIQSDKSKQLVILNINQDEDRMYTLLNDKINYRHIRESLGKEMCHKVS